MSDSFTIKDAFNTFTTTDYKKYMEQICITLNKNMDTPFKDYAEMIANDPIEWFNVFPEQLKSEAAFRKPFSAMSKLLNTAIVVENLGEDFCKAVTKKITVAWKNNFKSILDRRVGMRIGSAYGGGSSCDGDGVVDDAASVAGQNHHHQQQPTEAMDENDNASDLCDNEDSEVDVRIRALTKQAALLRRNNNELKDILVSYINHVHENDELTRSTIMKLVNHL